MQRFYVMSVQHNKEKGSENRTVPSAFDDIQSAKQKFHEVLSSDMKNLTLDWSVVYILDNFGRSLLSETWKREDPEKEVDPQDILDKLVSDGYVTQEIVDKVRKELEDEINE